MVRVAVFSPLTRRPAAAAAVFAASLRTSLSAKDVAPKVWGLSRLTTICCALLLSRSAKLADGAKLVAIGAE